MPKISIIIPVYNVEKYLKECLDSVIHQTFTDIEVICIDDGSTDSSLQILREYEKNDSRIKVFTQENSGSGVARNLGLDVATGEYIMFLDSDDWFEYNACELVYNKIHDTESDFVIFDFYSYKNSVAPKILRNQTIVNNLNKSFYTLNDLQDNFYKNSVVWSKIYNRNFIIKNNIRFSDYENAEDIQFSTSCFQKMSSLSFIDTPLYNYRVNNKSLSHTYSENWLYCTFNARKDAYNALVGNDKLEKAYIIYYIRSLHNWYKKISYFQIKIKNKYYKEMKSVYLFLSKERNIKELYPYINSDSFNFICNASFPGMAYLDLLQFIFNIRDSRHKKHKIITIFGKKYNTKSLKQVGEKFKNCIQNIFSVKNSQNKKYKIIKILGIKIKTRRKNG